MKIIILLSYQGNFFINDFIYFMIEIVYKQKNYFSNDDESFFTLMKKKRRVNFRRKVKCQIKAAKRQFIVNRK